MTGHSTLIGGSTAERLINCPASFRETMLAPQGGTSVYAEAGTACHDAIAYWLQNPHDDLTDKVFNEHLISTNDVETLLTPAWDALVDLQETYGGGFKVVGTEVQITFPGIPGAFGTLDVILQSTTHVLICDFKFGAGVHVDVTAKSGAPNSQLLFYTCGLPDHYTKNRAIVVAIIQPTFSPTLSHRIVTPKELATFRRTVEKAVEQALSAAPPHARGEHCRFAPCKVACPLWTGPLLDLTALGKPPPATAATPEAVVKWGQYLAAAKRLVDSALQYQKQIDAALISHLRQGGKAPGFALKFQATKRKWLEDTDYVVAELTKLGLDPREVARRSLHAFTVVDAAAKRLGVTVPDELRPRPIPTEFVLTDTDDPAAVDPEALTAEFTAALRKLTNK